MATFGTTPLFITLIILCCFLPNYTSSENSELAVEVCQIATDTNFCHQVIYSDSRASTADLVTLAYIVFDNAYVNMTNAQTAIQYKITETGNENADVLEGLTSCLANYTDAGRALSEVLGNLDTEYYAGLDKLSSKTESCVRDCEEGFKGKESPMKKENEDLIKLTNICSIVAQHFKYDD